jgi:putative colanic acid biosynthesis acetyltransferase WcaF
MNAFRPPRVSVTKRECPSPHSLGNKLGRVAWGLCWLLLFRPSPRICYAWRRGLLRVFGARIGRNARIFPSVRIWAPWNLSVGTEASIAHEVDLYCVNQIAVGDHATVSQYAFLCTASHDVSDPHMRLTHAQISVADQAWVCAGAFVAPGVAVGEGSVVGARAVVTRDVEPWTIVAGNPAKYLRRRVLDSGSDQGK